MTHQKGPHNRGNCPFHVVPNDPVSAEASICKCVTCVISNNAQMERCRDDLRQIAFLTIVEETSKYDPNHPSNASYTTFIKARVCTRLWSERRNVLRYVTFPDADDSADMDICEHNPLVKGLITEAEAVESLTDSVIRKLEVEKLRKYLPTLLAKLSDKERSVLEMKFWDARSGAEIALSLGISKGRVSQITKSALEKLNKSYISLLEKVDGNPYLC